MAGKNIYNPNEREQDEGFAGGVAAFARNASVAVRVPGAIAGAIGTGASVGANAAFGWLPFVGDKIGSNLTGAVTGSAKGTAENFTKVTGVDKLLAGVTFGARAFQAAGELVDGDGVGAAGKLARGAAEAAAVMFTLTGPIGMVVEVGSKLTTGKWLSEHFGDLAENVTTGVMGGTKEQRAEREATQVRGSFPAAAVAVPVGLAAAGLTAHHLMTKNGQQLTLGGLPGNRAPNGKELGKIEIDSPPVFNNQVMDVSYSRERTIERQNETNNILPFDQQNQIEQVQPAGNKGATFWRDKIASEGRGRGVAQNAQINSGNPMFNEAVSKAEMITQQREFAAEQGLTHAY